MLKEIIFLEILLIAFAVCTSIETSAVLVKSEDVAYEFYIEQEKQGNWFQAFNDCAARHMVLVALDSERKTTALEKELKEIYGNAHPNIWIGGIYENEEFIWKSTGQQFDYSNWAPYQPDNKGGKEHCAFLWKNLSYLWNDGVCSTNMFYVCEKIKRQ